MIAFVGSHGAKAVKRLVFALVTLGGGSAFAFPFDPTGFNIVAKDTAIFTQPPRAVPTNRMPDGPLLGNGDVGVVLGGPPEAQKFYIGKNDFWRKSDAMIQAVGNLTLTIPALQGASYRQEQDMANAEVRGTLTKGGTTVRVRSWVDATENLLITELQCEEGEPVDVSLTQTAGGSAQGMPSAVTDNDRPLTIGRELNGGGRYYFNGDIAGVSVVPRVLSAAEIRGMAGQLPMIDAEKSFDGKRTFEEQPAPKVSRAVSVSAWIQIEGASPEANYIVCKGDWDQAYSMGLSNRCLRWAINGTYVQTKQPLELHRWTHVAGTYDGHRMCLYVDGVLKGDKAGATDGTVDVKTGTSWFTHQSETAPDACKVAVVSRVIGGRRREDESGDLTFTIPTVSPVYIMTAVLSNLDSKDCLPTAQALVSNLSPTGIAKLSANHRAWWSDYWSRSFVEIPDKEIEKRWYAALYVLGSCSRAGKVAPGLWGNWVTTDSSSWFGSYITDYNFEAPYYIAYSANHADLAAPFYEAIEEQLPNGRAMAAQRGWSGVTLPVAMGPWGMHISGNSDWGMRSDAAFAALNFIWGYQYTQDDDFLRQKAYPYLREVADFWENYLKYENGRYVDYNDSIHELSGPDFNPLFSLGLVRTLFKNMVAMSEHLNVDADRRAKWQDICDNISAFPVQERDGRTVFRYSEKGMAWNDANTLGIHHIFPAGAIGLDSDPKLLQICFNTVDEMHRWADFNGFSSWYTACARIGYDPATILSKMREECDKHSLPNLLLYYGGGGIESCGGFLAINEMLLQSHEGVIRFFPVWPKNEDARFGYLRAVGAFLVSAEIKGGTVGSVKILSEKGRDCTVQNPWPGRRVLLWRAEGAVPVFTGDRFTFTTGINESVELKPE